VVGGTPTKMEGSAIPIIAHRGETVRTQQQEESVQRQLSQSGGGGRPVNVFMTVNTPNPDAFRKSRDNIVGKLNGAIRHSGRNS
jgi:hypothetical protein